MILPPETLQGTLIIDLGPVVRLERSLVLGCIEKKASLCCHCHPQSIVLSGIIFTCHIMIPYHSNILIGLFSNAKFLLLLTIYPAGQDIPNKYLKIFFIFKKLRTP